MARKHKQKIIHKNYLERRVMGSGRLSSKVQHDIPTTSQRSKIFDFYWPGNTRTANIGKHKASIYVAKSSFLRCMKGRHNSYIGSPPCTVT